MNVTHQHRHAERSCPSSRDDGHDRLGMRDRPWRSGCDGCQYAPGGIEVAKRAVLGGENASKVMDGDQQHLKTVKTYDCAVDLAPEALPPDFPPVILDLGCFG